MATGGVDPDSCSVCLEIFTCPKLLPCHHTFCAKCIDDVASKHAPRPFPCPICRKPTSLPPGGALALQENFYIKPKDPKLFCRSHQEVQLKYFCGRCDTAVCCECIVENHTDHKAVRIDTLVEDKKRELTREKQRLEIEAKKEKGDADKQLLEKSIPAIEKIFHEKHAATVKLADKIRDDAMNALQPFKDYMTQRTEKEQMLEDNLGQLTVLIKQLEDAAVKGTPIDRVALIKEIGKRPCSEAVKQRFDRDDFVFPRHVTLATEQDLMQTARSFFGCVTSSTQSTPEVTVVDKFNCGDHPDTTVFHISHVDTDPPCVWVSYEHYAQRQDAPEKAFDEDGTHVKDDSRVGKMNIKRYAKGRSMSIKPLKGGLKTYNKFLHTDHYRLNNDSSGEAKLYEVTVTSIKPYKTEEKLSLTIKVGPHRAHDVDQRQHVLIVVEEATPPSTCRKVLMYRPPGGDPVTTYTPPTPTFQPSDVCFYTLGRQHVLLVSDQANHAIHVVSVGEDTLTFQRFLTSGCPLLVCPTAINVDLKGRLWVACKGGRILTIQPLHV